MAMPMPNHPHDSFDRADRADRASEQAQPVSGTQPRRPAAAPARPTPDEEAMALMMKVVERVEVAKSFARIAAGILTVTAARASEQLRTVADAKVVETIEGEGGLKSRYGKIFKIARAAKDAAVHVATHRPDGPGTKPDAPPESDPMPDTEEEPVTQDNPEPVEAPGARAADHAAE